MPQRIHTFQLELTMRLMNEISKVDRFDASWDIIEKREGIALKQLKLIATVRSVGASTRIEGSKMTDAEVKILIENLKIAKLEERDEQEVAGYFAALDEIGASFNAIEITEGNIKNLHNILMQYCEKDAWHKGRYKQVSNAVEATYPDGTKQIIFKTAEPGFETEEGMKKLFEWYHSDNETLPIIKDALFIYDFLSIHPFQDGNGRLSRLLGTLLLLRHGYTWIQYVSFDHEIENRKTEYYKVLMQTQRQRPGEKVDEWVNFFLDCLVNIQSQLMDKLKTKNSTVYLGAKEKNIMSFIKNNPGTKSGEISKKLHIPLPTVKKILTNMVETRTIIKSGAGAGTNYHLESISPIKTDLMFKLTNKEQKKEFILRNSDHQVQIKKIVLVPLFQWTTPDEWVAKLIKQGVNFRIQGESTKGIIESLYSLVSFNNPFLFQPVFNLTTPINLPIGLAGRKLNHNEYPIKIVIELEFSVQTIDFDVLFVYDEEGN